MCIWPGLFRSARGTRSYASARFRDSTAPTFVRTYRSRDLILRIRPRGIIYMGRIENEGEREIERERGECEQSLMTTMLAMVVVPQVMVVMLEAAVLLAAVTPGHDSRAPVFEYNALYCPRHIIYLSPLNKHCLNI